MLPSQVGGWVAPVLLCLEGVGETLEARELPTSLVGCALSRPLAKQCSALDSTSQRSSSDNSQVLRIMVAALDTGPGGGGGHGKNSPWDPAWLPAALPMRCVSALGFSKEGRDKNLKRNESVCKKAMQVNCLLPCLTL